MQSIAVEWSCRCKAGQCRVQFCIRKTRDTLGREFKVRQFRAKSEVQTLRTESGVDFKSDSRFLGLHCATIFKNQPWLLRKSGETARNLHAHCSIVPFVNSAHIFTYAETTQTLLT